MVLSHKDLDVLLFPGSDSDSSEFQLGKMLQILREFSTDPILSMYVIDDVWDYMKAMKVCSHCFPLYMYTHKL